MNLSSPATDFKYVDENNKDDMKFITVFSIATTSISNTYSTYFDNLADTLINRIRHGPTTIEYTERNQVPNNSLYTRRFSVRIRKNACTPFFQDDGQDEARQLDGITILKKIVKNENEITDMVDIEIQVTDISNSIIKMDD